MKLNATDNIPELSLLDNARFTQVLVNLVSNAIKFTEEGGITVNIYFSDKDVVNSEESLNQPFNLL